MLVVKSFVSSFDIEIEQLLSVLDSLSSKNYCPAILESERTVAKLAGIDDKYSPYNLRLAAPTLPTRRRASLGDIFFREDEIYYLVSVPPDIRNTYINREEEEYYTLTGEYYISAGTDRNSKIEIGIFSGNPESLDASLNNFSNDVVQAVKATVDGRKVRHMDLSWNEVTATSKRLKQVLDANEDQGVQFSRATIEEREMEASKLLAEPPVRKLLVEISKAGFVREQDLLQRKGNAQDVAGENLASLKKLGLVQSEFLLMCRQTGNRLTRLKSREQLNSDEVSTLSCPMCSRTFKDELLSEGYSVSELGRKLSMKSHWMTVWVSSLLVDLGVPEGAIFWNLTENGEEVDLIVDFFGSVWIFELKDREFGPGDAYPFNYRLVRYQADRAVIISTEKVSKDAKKVFTELERESRRRGEQPVYIESLDKAPDILRGLISSAAIHNGVRRLGPLSSFSGYNLSTILKMRFKN